MRLFCDTLTATLERQLQEIELAALDPLCFAKEAMKLSMAALSQLQQQEAEQTFTDSDTTIAYYRHYKPKFMAKVLYYRTIYALLLNAPPGGKNYLNKYYKGELRKVQQFFDAHREFYRYYRSSDPQLDSFFFTNSQVELPFYEGSDSNLPGSAHTNCHKVAQILANDALVAYLETKIAQVKQTVRYADSDKDTPSLVWTGSKVALVELIYALHSSSVFQHGTVALTDIASAVSATFGVELGQFHRTFLEIRARKSDRAKFLTFLKDSLLTRMDDADAL